jgi:hypothetical protein
MQTKTISLTINPIIEHHLKQNPIAQGIIGIQLPGMASVTSINSVVSELFYQSDIQVVIIPPPLVDVFSSYIDKDVKSIGGRVQRDRLDGIRYNRVYVALYWDDLGSLNAHHHDIFFNFEEHKVLGGYRVSISDNRDVGVDQVFGTETTVSGDKLVIASQMKTTVDALASQSQENSADVLFSHKSLMLRKPSDWWIEFPENTDQKLMTVNVLKYIQDNEAMFARVIRQVKDRIVDGTFGMGIILDFPEYPNVKATMEDGARGKFVVIKVGMVGFYFSTERTMFLDWHALMIDQLDELAGE